MKGSTFPGSLADFLWLGDKLWRTRKIETRGYETAALCVLVTRQ